MKIGSLAHKELFCRSFIQSHQHCMPEQLNWPQLDGSALLRMQQIPFWEEALNTELAAGAKVNAFLPMVSDPLVKEAVALMGEEEARHGRMFRQMIDNYGIKLSGRPPNQVSANVKDGFIRFGYNECVDAFLGFGLFKIARQSGFLPDPMFNIFDILLQDEARHIVFFVNLVAYLQVNKGRGATFRGLHSLWNYGKSIQGLIGLVSNSAETNTNDFTATEASVFLEGFNVEKLISTSLQENARRMSSFDDKLLKPQFLPTLAKFALSGIKLIPKTSQSSVISRQSS